MIHTCNRLNIVIYNDSKFSSNQTRTRLSQLHIIEKLNLKDSP